jgi:hypothetical protein
MMQKPRAKSMFAPKLVVIEAESKVFLPFPLGDGRGEGSFTIESAR